MDQLDAMRLFVRIAEQGSFSAAARQMRLARSVVTRRISALESRLGAKLIARSTRRLSLTSAGSAFLENCREILDLLEAAEAQLSEQRQAPRGNLHVSLPVHFGQRYLAPLLLEFASRHSQVTLDMDFTDRRTNLIEEGLDLAIRITDRLHPGEVARRLGSAQRLVVAAPGYLQRYGQPRHPSELSVHECFSYTLAANASWTFLVDGKPLHVPIRGRIRANSGSVLLQAAVHGLGITCQPHFIAADLLAAGVLTRILDEFTLPEVGIYAVLPGNRHIPFQVRTLLEFLRERLNSGDGVQYLR